MSGWRVHLCLLILCSCAGLSFAKDNPEDLARPILKLAGDRSLFLPSAGSPFKLRLKFHVHSARSNGFEGDYIWVVTPAGDSRKETRMPGYDDLQVLKGSTLWTKRNLGFMPLQAAWAEYAMSNYRLINSGFRVERYSKVSDHHVELQCLEIMQGKNRRRLCFDTEGNLRKVDLPEMRLMYEYSDYRAVGSKYAPYKIAVKWDGEVVLDEEVALLAPANAKDESMIEIPVGAKQRSGCLDASLPSVSKTVPPIYPQDARERGQRGEVVLYMLIASSGRPVQESVVGTAGKSLDEAVLAVVEQWKYEPAKCGNTAIDSEALVQVNFTLEDR